MTRIPEQSVKTAVVLVNLGTPDEPTPKAIRRYLKEFLSDPRVVEAPRWLWWFVLRLFILPFRPRRIAPLYRKIWSSEGSPIRVLTEQIARQLQQRLSGKARVAAAMTYGNPSLPDVLDRLVTQEGVEKVIVLPLFPQYSATTTGAALDSLAGWMKSRRNLPEVCWVRDYATHPAYIQALVESIRQEPTFKTVDQLLFSFHGIPLSYVEKGDPYPSRCESTVRAVTEQLELKPENWRLVYQSRFGSQPWLQPYLDETLALMPGEGIQKVAVVCPGFATDCLETLEEIAVENREYFEKAGGKAYHYIPALNASEAHILCLEEILSPYLAVSSHQN